ncbi:c-type cytochrome [Sediminibacterium goheungense]|uniref:Cytochrome c n=1 Tax=Sediminibacterium goheungense TaxID=1086393 RepID=A0A4R6IVA5_9BACT|nr:cytochrome c [Sediminibacterium goheungense]TDO25815.1 cytochrome c [Sediminibacterium goheungense]
MKKKIFTVSTIVFIVIITSSFIQSDVQKSIARGKEVYGLYCQNCHMEDGNGMPEVNPPLVKADYMKRPAKDLISVILKGSTSSLTVNGKKYLGAMPAQEYLTDEQIADVLNYIKNSWGNKIPGPITPAMVKAQRK